MLSRVAESIYWMSRYIERVDNVARFIDVNLHMILDLTMGSEAQWMPLVSTTGDTEEFSDRYGEATQRNVIHFLTFDDRYSNSILSCVKRARESGRTVREIISSEMWEQLNAIYWLVTEASRRPGVVDFPHDFYNELRKATQLFSGITNVTMSRGEPWQFFRLGTNLERADKTSRILDVKYFILLPTVSHVGSPYDDIQWSAVLKSIGGFEMYRKQYGLISPRDVVEFLTLDRQFPRAIHFCVHSAEGAMYAISGSDRGTFRNPAEQKVGQLRAELAYTPVDDVINAGLHEFIDSLQIKLNRIGDAVHESFFAMRAYKAADRVSSQFQSQFL